MNRRDSPAFEQAEPYRCGELGLEDAVEAVTKTILKNSGPDEADWQASASAVEAVLSHPLGCTCERCY